MLANLQIECPLSGRMLVFVPNVNNNSTRYYLICYIISLMSIRSSQSQRENMLSHHKGADRRGWRFDTQHASKWSIFFSNWPFILLTTCGLSALSLATRNHIYPSSFSPSSSPSFKLFFYCAYYGIFSFDNSLFKFLHTSRCSLAPCH